MKRRQFISLLGGVAAWPVAARAQQSGQVRRIGVLLGGPPEGDATTQADIGALLQALRELGWTNGGNLRVDYRWPGDDAERERADAAELVGLKPDLIIAGSAPAVAAVAKMTSSTPIVQVMGADPVGLGLVGSLANPGGNITGFFAQEATMGGKWLEVLNEITPAMSRAMILQNTENPNRKLYFPWIEAAARGRNVQLTMPDVGGDAEIARVVGEFASMPNGGMIVLPGPFNTAHIPLIVAQAAQHDLPTVYPFPNFVEAGGLISYGVDPLETFRRSASYVDRILRGAKPADLPIQAPTNFELIVNLKTAKALGLTVSESFLLRANRVIE